MSRVALSLFRHLIPLLLFGVAAVAPTMAEGPLQHRKFERFSVRQGLASNTVYGLLQDRRGFLYVTTTGGLNRYDGYKFTVFKHDPLDANSLSASSTGRMLETRDGRIWIGTWGGGLNLFDPADETFTTYQNRPSDPDLLAENRIQSLFLDDRHRLWVGTYSKGIDRFDPASGRFIHYPLADGTADHLPDNRIWSIRQGGDDWLWIATDQGLVRFDCKTGKVRQVYTFREGDAHSLSHNRIKMLLRSRDGTLWVGTLNGLNRYRPETDDFERFFFVADTESGKDPYHVRALFEDRTGRIWIGTVGEGLWSLEPDSGESQQFDHDPTDPTSLSHSIVETILEDRAGNLWVGTLNGLNKTDLKPRKFKLYQRDPRNTNSLSTNEVGAIHVDSQQRLWIGTFGGGLNHYDRETGRAIVYPIVMHSGMGDNVVRNIREDEAGRLWLGTYSDGLQVLEPDKGITEVFVNDPDNLSSLSHNRVRGIHFDPRGRLWVGTEDGLNLFRPETKDFVNIHNDPFFGVRFRDVRIFALEDVRDRDELWLATNQGLMRLDFSQKSLARYRHVAGDPAALSDDQIFCLTYDDAGRFWVGSAAGLNRFDPETGRASAYYTNQGLPSNMIMAMLTDEKGRLWISTSNGLVRFDPETEQFRTYDVFDGLQDNNFNRNAAFKDRNGDLYFGGRNGFNLFTPSEVRDNPHVPPVVLTGFKKFNRDTRLETPIPEMRKLDLRHADNMFTLEFSALDFTNPEKNRYELRLTGFQNEWVDMGTVHQVTYTNLDSGSYVLQVRGSNNDQIWNEEGLRLKITIVPPVWQTWWAYGIYLFLGLFTATGIPLLRIRALKQRKAKLAATIADRTRELEQMNRKLGEKNREMVTLDEIVHAINREVTEERLLQALLVQGMKLVANAERGAVLIFNHQNQTFHFTAAVGYEIESLRHIVFSREEALERYTEGKEALETGIFLIRDVDRLPVPPKLLALSLPKTMLVMTVTARENIEDLLIFENFQHRDAFKNADLRRLGRYREHAITAIAKAKLFREATHSALHLKETQQMLLEAAHHAGMAEIASNVLHNVGNTLNSLNTCAGMIRSRLDSRSFEVFHRLVRLLESRQDDLEAFMQEDPKGRQVPEAFLKVGSGIVRTRDQLENEIQKLEEYIAALNGVVRAQQDYVGMEALSEVVDLHEALEEVIKLERLLLDSKQIQVAREYGEIPFIKVQKSKLVRVLVNLFNNAVDAMEINPHKRLLVLRTISVGYGPGVMLEIQDNGIGIPGEVIREVFHQGFTTKERGSGFGLHYCANVMREMGGEITIHSDGPGKGAMVRLALLSIDNAVDPGEPGRRLEDHVPSMS
ncbi:sensor histidine kinase [Sulfidibacter corallicola]|uniref:histidine kinase n=1 Tax=Sulfidibacter corallicola TaxID=2818388 RepID=A0A8A4THI3_SULCO|nr:two-component regulator propeller domain-containing protein [Sulfidibacter corallicola]QTD48271.1 hypothetical protein J3U87_22025 [Sulfidibacter corallicola]